MEYRMIRKNNMYSFDLNQIYAVLDSLRMEYPNFKDWYYNTVIPGLRLGTRSICCVYDENQIAAVLILKNEGDEKKICTLRVSPQFRRQGIGSALLDIACQELQTEQPIITVSSNHYNEFRSLFLSKGFEEFAAYPGYYRESMTEFSFNGPLNDDSSGRKCA